MKSPAPETVCGWGRIPALGREIRSDDLETLTENATLTRGLARSYGDSSLPPASQPVVVATPLADRILEFDGATGRLRAEAGLSLEGIIRLFLPRGWFVPVTPGTQFVTLGGMVAADVHGKNHHREGCFGEHVGRIRIRVASGRILWCSRTEEPELFRATLGGMGLTGHILEVEFQMAAVPSPWIIQETEKIGDLPTFIAKLREAAPAWPFTVGWIDALSRGRRMGRGILIRGRWAEPGEAPAGPPEPKRRLTVPFVFPGWVLSRAAMKAFNAVFYGKHFSRQNHSVVGWESFFYPLDSIAHWNRIYGPRGFTQYQCVLPDSGDSSAAAARVLQELTRRGGASFLSVIKDCGPEGTGLLSFPKSGISLALDIAVTGDTPSLVSALNDLVLADGGRVYLAKDSFTTADQFRKMEPRLEKFLAERSRWDPQRRIRSAQSVRLMGDPE